MFAGLAILIYVILLAVTGFAAEEIEQRAEIESAISEDATAVSAAKSMSTFLVFLFIVMGKLHGHLVTISLLLQLICQH